MDKFKGRWLTLGAMTVFFLLIISRPAFGRLCGRVVGLSVRFCLRRFVALIVTVIDSVLDEIILQTETALLLEITAICPA